MHLKESKLHVIGHIEVQLKTQYFKVNDMLSFFLFCKNNSIQMFIYLTTEYNLEIAFSDAYFLSRLPIVNLRLAQGGVRLAATLNRIFG